MFTFANFIRAVSAIGNTVAHALRLEAFAAVAMESVSTTA